MPRATPFPSRRYATSKMAPPYHQHAANFRPHKRPYTFGDSDFPQLGHSDSRPISQTRLPPIIVKFIDGKSGFNDLSIPQREALKRRISSLVGPIHECSIARDGGLFIVPSDTKQRDALLKLDQNISQAGRLAAKYRRRWQ